MNRLSLRTRLVALAVLLVAFAVTLVGVATYALLSSYLFRQLDNRLVQTANDSARAAPFIVTGRGLPPSSTRIDRDTCAVWLQDDTVQTLLRPSDDPSTLDLTTARYVVSDGGPTTVHATTGESVRAIPASIAVGDSKLQLVVTLPTAGVDDALRRLLALELAIGGAAVLATGILGAAGVRLGMRPLDRVTRTARTVAAELGPDGRGLQNRVPNADPHTEVGQLAEAVNTMLGAVEREYAARYESEQRLRRFLADASHELRTPLTSLRGYAELVRLRGGLDEDASDSLRRIETEGMRMGGLVDDLLTLARSDRGIVAERVPVDVADVVDDAVAGVRAAYPARQVEVTARGPLPVLGDRDQLLQVVTNILTNAAVHATAPVPIRVSADREDAEIVVRVIDGGPGLPPEQAAQVFDRFWRADAARTRVRGGSGLGLSIVQALIADYGGRVSFDSAVASGSTVTVRLPAAPLPAAPPPPALATPAPTPPAPTSPALSAPALSAPAPAGSASAGSAPAGSTPAAPTPAGSTPAGSAPAGSTPAAPTPAGSTPAGSTPAAPTPAGSAPAGSAPAAPTPSPPAASPPVRTAAAPASPAPTGAPTPPVRTPPGPSRN